MENKYKTFITFLENVARNNPLKNALINAFSLCYYGNLQESVVDDNKVNWDEFTDPMVVGGVKLMKLINSLGYQAYIVGGAVRDIAMGDKNIHDVDIATNMPIDKIKDNFRTIEYGGGEKHGTVIVRFEKNDYELTQFRTEGKYLDKRRPESVTFVDSFEEDSKRRDFTWNAMGIDAAGNLHDYHGGLDDIKAKRLRTVGNPRERFYEGDDGDVLRMMRVIRFASRFDFKVDDNVIEAIKDLKDHITETSMERIRDEIISSMKYGGSKFANAIKLFDETGLLAEIAPDIKVTDVKLNAISKANSNSPEINFAILMHDVSPKQTFDIGSQLKLDNKQRDAIVFVVTNLPNYVNLSELDRQVALKIVNSQFFATLTAVADAIGLRSEKNDATIEKISTFNAILEREKVINKLIQDNGIEGANFGVMSKKTKQWLFSEFEKGNTPSDSDVDAFIKDNK